jgi:hypothetical protein
VTRLVDPYPATFSSHDHGLVLAKRAMLAAMIGRRVCSSVRFCVASMHFGKISSSRSSGTSSPVYAGVSKAETVTTCHPDRGLQVGRGGTPDEVGTVGALLMGPEGGFITGSDFLMDGGVTAAYRFGDLAPKWAKLSRHQHAFKGNLMEYHILGRTGVSVRTCALGAMMFGPWGDPRP